MDAYNSNPAAFLGHLLITNNESSFHVSVPKTYGFLKLRILFRLITLADNSMMTDLHSNFISSYSTNDCHDMLQVLNNDSSSPPKKYFPSTSNPKNVNTHVSLTTDIEKDDHGSDSIANANKIDETTEVKIELSSSSQNITYPSSQESSYPVPLASSPTNLVRFITEQTLMPSLSQIDDGDFSSSTSENELNNNNENDDETIIKSPVKTDNDQLLLNFPSPIISEQPIQILALAEQSSQNFASPMEVNDNTATASLQHSSHQSSLSSSSSSLSISPIIDQRPSSAPALYLSRPSTPKSSLPCFLVSPNRNLNSEEKKLTTSTATVGSPIHIVKYSSSPSKALVISANSTSPSMSPNIVRNPQNTIKTATNGINLVNVTRLPTSYGQLTPSVALNTPFVTAALKSSATNLSSPTKKNIPESSPSSKPSEQNTQPTSTTTTTTLIESSSTIQNTTNLSNITANNINVNNINVNIHTTNLQPVPSYNQNQNNNSNINNTNTRCNTNMNRKQRYQHAQISQFDEKQTTEIVSQLLKNIKEETKRREESRSQQHQLESGVGGTTQHQSINLTDSSSLTTTNYNINISNIDVDTATNIQKQCATTMTSNSDSSSAKWPQQNIAHHLNSVIRVQPIVDMKTPANDSSVKAVPSNDISQTSSSIFFPSPITNQQPQQMTTNTKKRSRSKKQQQAPETTTNLNDITMNDSNGFKRVIIKGENELYTEQVPFSTLPSPKLSCPTIVKSRTNSTTTAPTGQKNTKNSILTNTQVDFIHVPYGWRRVVASDLVIYLSPTNTVLDSYESVRRYLETPSTCKCGLQCPLVVEKVFNFKPTVQSKSWEVTQVLEGTHCRQKSNILEMATLTNCIDSFGELEQKTIKRRKRPHSELNTGNVFVCSSTAESKPFAINTTSTIQTCALQSNHDSSSSSSSLSPLASNTAIPVLSSTNNSELQLQRFIDEHALSWNGTQTFSGLPTKRPRGRPRKMAKSSDVVCNQTGKLSTVSSSFKQHVQQYPSLSDVDSSHELPPAIAIPTSTTSIIQNAAIPSSILSPPASVSSSQTGLHRNSTSPSTTTCSSTNQTIRYLNDISLTPPSVVLNDTNFITRLPSLFDSVKSSTTNESTYAVLSGVQNVLFSPPDKCVRRDSITTTANSPTNNSMSINTVASNKQVTLNMNALKPDFIRYPAQKPLTNHIDAISLTGATNHILLGNSSSSTIINCKNIVSGGNMDPISTTNDEQNFDNSLHHQQYTVEQPQQQSNSFTVDFDPSITDFLLSAMASGTSIDSNRIVNHLFNKAQNSNNRTLGNQPAAQQVQLSKLDQTSLDSSIKNVVKSSTRTGKVRKTTTNTKKSTTTMKNNSAVDTMIFNVPTNLLTDNCTTNTQYCKKNVFEENSLTKNVLNDDQTQQIFLINNKPYVIQQVNHEQQQRLSLDTPSTLLTQSTMADDNDMLQPRSDLSMSDKNNCNPSSASNRTVKESNTDDSGNCYLLNGPVEPKTLRTLLKGLNSSPLGVDNLINTINRLENGNIDNPLNEDDCGHNLLKSVRTTNKNSPVKVTNAKSRRPTATENKKLKLKTNQTVMVTSSLNGNPITTAPSLPVETNNQDNWQTQVLIPPSSTMVDFNSFDFSLNNSSWQINDNNLNNLLLNDDFDTTFDDVNFDFEPLLGDISTSSKTLLPSLFDDRIKLHDTFDFISSSKNITSTTANSLLLPSVSHLLTNNSSISGTTTTTTTILSAARP
ncbi:unnamed protein product [Didymodactylos carnosus]|uniref:MBD domain-containing protein n=1 Tax=Didymodactylos carnosus TaxID=1234261 RepID=A0A814GPJ3_9BILA|nr:unnamed protein product [Didymodactylos carnosus]CAF0999282.1 unnamed protein product [Didymodactylos carnosus]CAF3598076.1 unnamed protein product [Didymodactylos carnosus]CAF3770753.1 unnamed protein product [Didymodactylos carnosus]